eukprot:481260-Hanusia_phi.AAC.1
MYNAGHMEDSMLSGSIFGTNYSKAGNETSTSCIPLRLLTPSVRTFSTLSHIRQHGTSSRATACASNFPCDAPNFVGFAVPTYVRRNPIYISIQQSRGILPNRQEMSRISKNSIMSES